MKALVTGASGFIGSHLCDLLLGKGFQVTGTWFSDEDKENVAHLEGEKRFELVKCDLSQKQHVLDLASSENFDSVFHLAAQAFVVPSWKDPWNTFRVNVEGTISLFEALREKPETRIVLASSSAAYGDVNPPPFKETDALQPNTPYGVSKATQDLLGYQYWRNYGMSIVRARIFNTTGPRKVGDVHADFARQVAEMEKGQRSVMRVGNLEMERECNHVLDLCESLWMMHENASPGSVYNACSSKTYKVKEFLDAYLRLATVPVKVEQDKSLFRKTEERTVLGDDSKLKTELGWKQRRSMEETVSDVLEYWRGRSK